MCIGIPGKIVKIEKNRAKIKQKDHFHWVDLGILSEKVKIGDYLICYQNTAINKISSKEAQEILDLLKNTK